MVLRPAVCAVRAFATKKADSGNFTNADITKMFNELDASAGATAAPELPVKLTGRSGELVQEAYVATSKKAGAFDKFVKDFEGLVAAAEAGDIVVNRFFSTNNYSPEECQKVVELLTASADPLTSYAAIKPEEVRDIIIDNEGNMDSWRAARKAVQGLALSEEAKSALNSLAAEARLDLVKKVAEKAGELRAATSKSIDAIVTSAVALSKEQQAAISKALPSYAPAGSAVSVTYTVDPAVLGGLLISLKNQTIDLSVTSKLVEVVAASRASQLA